MQQKLKLFMAHAGRVSTIALTAVLAACGGSDVDKQNSSSLDPQRKQRQQTVQALKWAQCSPRILESASPLFAQPPEKAVMRLRCAVKAHGLIEKLKQRLPPPKQ